MRKKLFLVAGGLVAVAGSGLAATGFVGGDGSAPQAAPPVTATAEVTKGALNATRDFDGKLGFGGTRTLNGGKGVLTWVAPSGRVVGRGGTLYKADNERVPLLFGPLPLWRPLSAGAKGPDVQELEENLRALGYGEYLTVDAKFSDATAAAVKRWQQDLDLPETGSVEPGSVVVAPGPIRVGEHRKELGDQAAGPVFAYTGQKTKVTMDLPVADQGVVKKGAAVTVTLPDGRTVKGVVTSVGTIAKTTGDQMNSKTTVPVTISLKKKVKGLDQAPVTVTVTTSRRSGVLTVPVSALLAAPGGGYEVEVVDGAAKRRVRVEVGSFAQGRVEVSGDGLDDGALVGVPA